VTATYRTFSEALEVALQAIRGRWPGADTSVGSTFYHFACILAAARMGATGYAKSRYMATRPDQALGADLVALAAAYGMTPRAATTTPPYGLRCAVAVTGSGAWLAGMVLTTASGLSFQCSAGGAWTAAGTAYLYIASTSTGAACNLPTGTTLTITGPPAGMAASATVDLIAVGYVPARDTEKDSELQQRLSDRVGGTATSGNEAAFWSWIMSDDCALALFALDYSPPQEAFIYPGIRSVMDVSATVFLAWTGIAKITNVAGYYAAIETYINTIRPIGTVFDAVVCAEQGVALRVTLDTDTGYGRDWGATATSSLTTAAAAHTSKRIYLTAAPSSQNLAAGHHILLCVGSSYYPNVRTISAVDNSANWIEVSVDLKDESGNATAATNGRTMRPAGPISQACVDAILTLYAGMTPGDTAAGVRWPPVDQDHATNLTAGMVHRALLDADSHIWDVTINAGAPTVCTAASLAAGVLLCYVIQPQRANDWIRIEFNSLNT